MNDNLYPSFSVLLVDDETPWLRSLSLTLEGSGGITNVIQCQDSRQVPEILSRNDVGLILLDLTMPYVSGEDLLSMVSERYPEVKVIVISAMNQLETAVQCMKQGAFDYYVKTVEEDRLINGVSHAIRIVELQRETLEISRRLLSEGLDNPEVFRGMPSVNKKMHAIFRYAEAVARSRYPILITGESGVGKELIAKAIHCLSRPGRPMMSVNISGLDDGVFADTLFGHVRGAFTGAEEPRSGLIEQAADGTLFLDEIGDLSQTSQVKLLRILQDGEYLPVGSDRHRQLRARLVVATNQDLMGKQASGQFRRDLYHRLCTHHIYMPPLRERREDIPVLLDYFLEEAARELDRKKPAIPKELVVLLNNYSFPGNVRELRSMVFDAMSVHKAKMLSMDTFRSTIQQRDGAREYQHPTESPSHNIFSLAEQLPQLSNVEDLLIAEAMRRAEGNQSIAARLLGISQPALSKRLRPQK